MKKLLVLQSGGPTAVINASLVGIIREAKKAKCFDGIMGAINGIEGLYDDKVVSLDDLQDEKLDAIMATPSAYLGVSRLHLSDDYLDKDFNIKPDYSKVFHFVKKYEITNIIIIGGNDSMDNVYKMERFFKGVKLDINVIGVPKTVDNDMLFSDHTPGYGSALKYITTAISEIKLDLTSFNRRRVAIVEVMGRDTGWLTAGAKLASLNGLGPDLIYLPEVELTSRRFIDEVKEAYEGKKEVLIVISEGVKNEMGNYWTSNHPFSLLNEEYGEKRLGGASTVLAKLVKDTLGVPVRSIQLNLMQRCAGHVMSETDLNEAFECGAKSIDYVLNDTGKVVVLRRLDTKEYKISYELVNAEDLANKLKVFPKEWIVNGNDVSNEFIEYAKPLIQGEVYLKFENGVPKYVTR